jgi:hypothetical protein
MTTNPLIPIRKITESLRQVQAAPEVSSELKVYAQEIDESLRPVLKIFQKSISEIQESLSVSFEKINLARETWKAKQRICEINSLDIWDEIGKVSGFIQKVKLEKSRLRILTVDAVKTKCNSQFILIKDQNLKDSQGNPKSLSVFDIPKLQNKFTEAIADISLFCSQIILERLQEIFALYDRGINREQITEYLFWEDPKSQEKFQSSLNLAERELNASWENHSDIIKVYLSKFEKEAIDKFKSMKKKSIAQKNTQIEAYDRFEQEISQLISQTIESIFDERVELTTVILDDVLSFYDYLLEQQQRYSQESPQMRKAEKDWIDTQEYRLKQSSNQMSEMIEICNTLLN